MRQLVHLLELRQGHIINSFKTLIQKKLTGEGRPVAALNSSGVCLALSMAFAHAHLCETSSEESPEIFHNLLEQLVTVDGVENFYQSYDFLSKSYVEAVHAGDQAQAQKLKEQLKPKWAQMAMIDLMLVVYASPSSSYFLRDIDSRCHKKTLAAAGLSIDGSVSLQIPIDSLSDFLFRRQGFFSSIISPFKRSGTYILSLPGHACAVNVAEDGSVTMYDPNHSTYITNEKDLEEYQSLFAKYYRNFPEKVIPIEVFSVSLTDKNYQKKNINERVAQKIQSRLDRSAAHFLRKNYRPEQWEKMLEKGYMRILFYTQTPQVRSLLIKTLDYCAKNNINDFWQRSGFQRRVTLPLIENLLYAVHQTRDFELLEVIFSYKRMKIWGPDCYDLLKRSVKLNDTEMLNCLLKHLPPNYHMNRHLLLEVEKHYCSERISCARPIVIALLQGQILPDLSSKERHPMEYLRKQSPRLFCLAVDYWLQQNAIDGDCLPYEVDGKGLLFWMIESGTIDPKKVIPMIEGGCYELADSDFWAILQTPHTEWKMSLLKNYGDKWDWDKGELINPIESCFLSRDPNFLQVLLDRGIAPKLTNTGLKELHQVFFEGCFELVERLFSQSNIEFPEPKSFHDREVIGMMSCLYKIWNQKILDPSEKAIFGKFVEQAAKQPSLISWINIQQLPVIQALSVNGENLVENWLKSEQWEKIQAFWDSLTDLKDIDKKLICQATVQSCMEQQCSNWHWQKQWVERASLSWDDFLPEHRDFIDELYAHSQTGRGIGLAQALSLQPSQKYVGYLSAAFSQRVSALSHAQSHEALLRLVSELDAIKDLMGWGGLHQSDGQKHYAALAAAMQEIHRCLPQIDQGRMTINVAVEQLFSTPAVARFHQQEQEEECVVKTTLPASVFDALRLLSFGRNS